MRNILLIHYSTKNSLRLFFYLRKAYSYDKMNLEEKYMKSIIKYHSIKYPNMTTQDYTKLLYQSFFGPGHFIKDIDFVNEYYYKELQNIQDCFDKNLYEHIGNNFVRVNMNIFSKHFPCLRSNAKSLT